MGQENNSDYSKKCFSSLLFKQRKLHELTILEQFDIFRKTVKMVQRGITPNTEFISSAVGIWTQFYRISRLRAI